MTAKNTPPRRSRRRRLAGWLVRALLVTGLSLGIYSCFTSRALRNEIASTPRDPTTGVVIGAEAIDLDPPSPAPGNTPTSACLLLHGWVGSPKDFADLGECLAEAGYHVRLARLPGHGTTPLDFAAQSPESMLEGVETEYSALRERYAEVNVIGFSMGGTLATLLASREDVDRLVLVSPYFRVTYKLYYILPAETWRGAAGWMLPYIVKPKSMVRVNRKEARQWIYCYHIIPTDCVRILTQLGKGARQPDTLEAITCPVLLVIAKGDDAASPAAAQRAVRAMSNADPHVRLFSKRSNHIILWDYDRAEAEEAILQFLASPRFPGPSEENGIGFHAIK